VQTAKSHRLTDFNAR